MEKFAIFNLLKALNTISTLSNANRGDNEENKTTKDETSVTNFFKADKEFNAMSQILVRHEKISNRVRKNK